MIDPKETEVVDNPVVDEPILDTTKEPEGIEVTTDDVVDSSGNKPSDGPGLVRGFMQKLGILKADEPETIEEDIPDEFTKAAKDLGWSDEDIVEFATDYTNEQLTEMIPTLYPDEAEEPAKEQAVDEETPDPPTKDSEDKDDTKSLKDEIREEIRNEFQKEIDSLKESLGQVAKKTESQNTVQLLQTINEVFDKVADEFEIFGKTDKLPVFPAGPKKGQFVPTSPQIKAREEVWEKAQAFMSLGANVKEAMEDAVTWYKGKHLEKDIHRKLIKDLKSKETKLSAKRFGKETVPTYANEDERQRSFILEQAEKLGLKLAAEEDWTD